MLKPMKKTESFVYFDDDYSRTTAKFNATVTQNKGTAKEKKVFTPQALKYVDYEIGQMAEKLKASAAGLTPGTPEYSAAVEQAEQTIGALQRKRDAFAKGQVRPEEMATMEKYIFSIRKKQERDHVLSAFPGWNPKMNMSGDILQQRYNVE